MRRDKKDPAAWILRRKVFGTREKRATCEGSQRAAG
jgi:hypothetical protein